MAVGGGGGHTQKAVLISPQTKETVQIFAGFSLQSRDGREGDHLPVAA